MKQSGVYSIFNISNGKRYIGSSTNLAKRWSSHRSLLNFNRHSNLYLQRSWRKYGHQCFVFETLELTDNLIEREQFFIDFFRPEFNLNLFASPGKSLANHPQRKEILAKMSSTLSRNNKIRFAALSEAGKRDYLAKRNFGFQGKKHSAKSIESIRRKLQGRTTSNAQRVSADGVIYDSLRHAARILDVHVSTISWRVKKWPTRYWLM